MRGFSLFDTFQPELKGEKVVYGLHSNIQTYNPIKKTFHKWINVFKGVFFSKNFFYKKKLNYFIKPLVWKHDGYGILSNDLRKEWLMGQQKNVAKKNN